MYLLCEQRSCDIPEDEVLTDQSSFTADTGTYRVCADKVVCKRVYEVERILLN